MQTTTEGIEAILHVGHSRAALHRSRVESATVVRNLDAQFASFVAQSHLDV